MRLIVVTVILAIAAVFMALPYVSLSTLSYDEHDMSLTLEVKATCPSYLKPATFTHTQVFDEELGRGYFDYLLDYWSFGGGSSLPDYPYLSVIIQEEYNQDSREVWRVPYVYGETIEWSGEYLTNHGEILFFELAIIHAKDYSSSVGWKEIVP